jgi:recombination protein RecT
MSDAATATPPPAPTRVTTMKLRDAKTIGEALQTQQFQRAVADAAPQHMTATRLMATFRQAARNNPAFDQCSLMSVLGVFMTCTFLGLEPNTPQGHAYMIPFKKRRYDKALRKLVDDGYDLQLVIGYQGYLDLAYRSPRVQSVAAHAVFEGDDFSFEYGSNEHLQHRPKGLQSDTDVPRYFYMFSKLQGGQAFEVLPYSRVIQIRNGSQGYQAALAAKENAEMQGWKIPASYTEAPWIKHFSAMGMKSAMRAGYKWLPKTIEMAAVTRLEDAQDRNLIDFGPVIEGNVNPLEEDLPPLHEPRSDPGAAYGERQNDNDDPGVVAPMDGEVQNPAPAPAQPASPPRPAAPPPPAQRAQPAAAPAAAPAPTPAPAPPATAPVQGFAAFLADAAGEIVERFGEAGYMTDAAAFATAYAEIWTATVPADRLALAEHNADGLADAAAESQQAAAILAALGNPAPSAAPIVSTDAEPVAIVVVVNNGRPDLKGYLDGRRAAAAAQTAASFPAWESLQRPVITALSTVTRRAAEKICADRATALGTDKPPAPTAAPPPPATPTEPPPAADEPPPNTGDDAPAGEPAGLMGDPLPPAQWSRAAQQIVDDLLACKSMGDADAIAHNAAVQVAFRQITAADPDEGQRLTAFATERRRQLTQPR